MFSFERRRCNHQTQNDFRENQTVKEVKHAYKTKVHRQKKIREREKKKQNTQTPKHKDIIFILFHLIVADHFHHSTNQKNVQKCNDEIEDQLDESVPRRGKEPNE